MPLNPDWRRDELADERQQLKQKIRRGITLAGGCFSIPILLIVAFQVFVGWSFLPQLFLPARGLCQLAEEAANRDPRVRDEFGRLHLQQISGSRSSREGLADAAQCSAVVRGSRATVDASGSYGGGQYRLESVQLKLLDPERTLHVALTEQ